MSGARTLTLTLAQDGRRLPPGLRTAYEFRQCGGSIGRADDSDWVLAAPGISRTHAVVRYVHGLYFLEDRSTNGMLRNGAPLARGEPVTLDDGDRLQMDTFEVAVSLRDAAPALAAPAAAPAEAFDDDRTIAVPSRSPAAPVAPAAPAVPIAAPPSPAAPLDAFLADPVEDLLAGIGGGELDPLRLFDPAPPPPAMAPPPADPGWNHSAGSADHFRPPRPSTPAQLLPEEWDLTRGDFAMPAPPAPAASPAAPAIPAAPAPAPPVVQPAPAAPPPPAQAVASVAATAAVPAELDAILRIVIDGVMEVLRARAEIKNTFRLPVTIIQRSENNPLKFAATPGEAMQRLMQPDGAFLSGADAFEDAFNDIRFHQVAMLAGMRAAFESLLAHFNPDRLERAVDGAGGRRAFSGKARYWERYREDFAQAARDPDECFRMLFGDEFAKAYEAQLARLKSARRREQR